LSNLVTDYGLDAFAATLHETAIEKGFWDGEISYDKLGNKLALVHSEVTEVLEALRKSKGSEEVVEEISDVIIRLLDIYKDIKKLGSELEENFHDRDIRNSSKARPQNKTKSSSRSRSGNTKAKDTKHRSKPST